MKKLKLDLEHCYGIKKLEAKIEIAENKVLTLKDFFRTLLHELMTAKTRVSGFSIANSK